MTTVHTNIRRGDDTGQRGARLARIAIYPVKSLPGIELDQAMVLPTGALAGDRQFAMCDAQGAVVNGKRMPRMHALRSAIDLERRLISLWSEDAPEPRSFHFDGDRAALQSWLGEYFGVPITLTEDRERGLPDDPDSPGPTIVSTATLAAVAEWFGFELGEARRRFRANLEIDGVAPFWEDCLLGADGTAVEFQVGQVRWLGVNPCARCVVPSRSSLTGEVDATFAKSFAERRKGSLPPWAPPSRFDHFYRLAVNTKPATNTGGRVRIGDGVTYNAPHEPSTTR